MKTLGLVHRRAFAGRAAGDQYLYAAFYLSFEKRSEAIVIDRTVFFEGGDEGGRAAPLNSS
jgi:hypothetical protein